MSPEVLRIVITGVVGLVTAFILALVNSWISARAGTDETLRAERLNVYPVFCENHSSHIQVAACLT